MAQELEENLQNEQQKDANFDEKFDFNGEKRMIHMLCLMKFPQKLGILLVDLKRGWNILDLEIEPVRFALGKQSALAPERVVEAVEIESEDGEVGDLIDIDPRIRLIYSANEDDIEGIKELLDS
ncbi:hypothetical protein CQW23_18656 [Capsicum baccatum]|uniref:Uncharacterized protein n=1 Tax=Capsicum baccatum TaxID=33114 RepID=A0A2G2W3I6_CAPBA|nr:hypothetical protein CQW23_18656 [Capsicum baccatum]